MERPCSKVKILFDSRTQDPGFEAWRETMEEKLCSTQRDILGFGCSPSVLNKICFWFYSLVSFDQRLSFFKKKNQFPKTTQHLNPFWKKLFHLRCSFPNISWGDYRNLSFAFYLRHLLGRLQKFIFVFIHTKLEDCRNLSFWREVFLRGFIQ